MQLNSSQVCDLQVGQGCTSIGTSSHPFLAGALLELVNTPSITLNGATVLSSVSPFFGGYTGYSDETITWQAPSVNAAGGVEVLAEPTIFRPTDSVSPQNMYGIVITDAAKTNLLFAAPFDVQPLPMQSALNTIQVTLQWQPKTGGIAAVVA